MTEFHLYLNRHLFHLDDYIGTYQPLTNTVSLRKEYSALKDNPYFKGAIVNVQDMPTPPAAAPPVEPVKAEPGRPKKILPN